MSSAKKSFECDSCKSKFARKDALLRHIWTRRSSKCNGNLLDFSTKTLFECDTCKFKSTRKDTLVRHLPVCRVKTNTLFECDKCNSKYKTKASVLRHIRGSACYKKSEDPKLACLKCSLRVPTKRELKKHYIQKHQILFKSTNLTFPSFEAVQKWIHDIERKNFFRFRIETTQKCRSHIIRLYRCHRSGTYVDTCANKRRKRFLKNCGSKKIQGWCPAELKVRIQSSNGTCEVQYQETHIGHNRDENELCHIYLNKNEKSELAARLAEGVPIPHLKKRIYLSEDVNQGCSRIRAVNLKDLHNITSSYGVKTDHPPPFHKDELNVKESVEVPSEIVVCYENQAEADSAYETLHDDDLVIVYMNDDHESAIESFDEEVVYVEETSNLISNQNCDILAVDADAEINFEDNGASSTANIEDVSCTNIEAEEKERVIEELKEFLGNSLSIATSREQLYEIKEKYLNPIQPALAEAIRNSVG